MYSNYEFLLLRISSSKFRSTIPLDIFTRWNEEFSIGCYSSCARDKGEEEDLEDAWLNNGGSKVGARRRNLWSEGAISDLIRPGGVL